MENPNFKKPNKYAVLVTYLIAVVCLLLGLFLPLWGGGCILALQLPDVFGKIANLNVPAKWSFTHSYIIDLFGTGLTVDIMAYVALLYTVITALSLIALIPVIICVKKDSAKISVFAYIVEIAAVIITSLYVIIALQCLCNTSSLFGNGSGLEVFSYNMVIALGGSLLALIVLSVMSKKGSGVLKTALLLLSAIALLTLYDLTELILGFSSGGILLSLFSNGTSAISGLDCLQSAFGGSLAGDLQLASSAGAKAALVLCTIASVLVILNYFIDVISLATNGTKSGRRFGLVRYAFALLVILALIITVAASGSGIGIMLIALPVVVLIQLLISVLRMLLTDKKAKKADKPVEELPPASETEEEPVHEEPAEEQPEALEAETVAEEEQAAAQAPVQPEPTVTEQEVREEPPVRQNENYGFNEPVSREPYPYTDIEPVRQEPVQQPVQPPVRTQQSQPVRANVYGQSQQQGTQYYTINTIYGGPVDEFLRKLSNEERVEFAVTFIEKRKGNLGNIPDYVIGGNNRLFFSSVFIYLGRIRGLISDGLLNKMYKELNIL